METIFLGAIGLISAKCINSGEIIVQILTSRHMHGSAELT
jgi:hypothetical protein